MECASGHADAGNKPGAYLHAARATLITESRFNSRLAVSAVGNRLFRGILSAQAFGEVAEWLKAELC